MVRFWVDFINIDHKFDTEKALCGTHYTFVEQDFEKKTYSTICIGKIWLLSGRKNLLIRPVSCCFQMSSVICLRTCLSTSVVNSDIFT